VSKATQVSTEAAAIEAVCRGEHDDPFAVLGPHQDGEDTVIRAFLPDADRAWVVRQDGTGAAEMDRVHRLGMFRLLCPKTAEFTYRLRTETAGRTDEMEDPYRFGLLLGEVDVHLLAEGTHRHLYEVLGAHPTEVDGVAGVAFSVWAPNARRVSVVGDFNRWDGLRHPMRRRPECGVWELFMPGLTRGVLYKFEIKGTHGELLPLKADPFAFAAESRPSTASIVHGLPLREWRDESWMSQNAARNAREAPISIYEVHLGSWMRVPEEGNRFFSYRELAQRLVPYVHEMGFTHVELLPVSEHPFDGSWGYQPIGLFAPTSRFGPPEDFAALVQAFHDAGIGVILDWVPAHFPTDAHGLARFDGTPLYEHEDPRKGFHRDWGTLIYNFGRREVANFLIANVLFWLRHYHVDGIRVDAVASMLYLDYSREPGDWIPNEYGGNENLEAISFIRRMNEIAYGEIPGAITIAEESTAWPGVSRPTWLGGLGFGYKWNMGWMHDTLRYMSNDPIRRRFHHDSLTFGLLYAFSENFVLPLSHDEVVHGKGSLLGRMPGDQWQRFANLRAYFGFMYAHPGKKLLFMGGEFGQEREWNSEAGLDWHLLDDPLHLGVQRLVRTLNETYRQRAALHVLDCEHTGFEWIDTSDRDSSIISFLRKGTEGTPPVVVVCNFTPVTRAGYRVGVPIPGRYEPILNTDDVEFGGSGAVHSETPWTEPVAWQGQAQSLVLMLPGLSTLWLTPAED
jgi:1,4-alpha-glucan branching enzyme